ncbi:ATP-binding protein [Microbispora sp. NBC_01189]|uniref:ATP-binding protein n=1 Tax=Microbispora sp. NBC_01189 TaxID=2903583 RepID=UPI002E13B7A3|nr:ATP-binding protein [Microbispora sp. NBC_01189]
MPYLSRLIDTAAEQPAAAFVPPQRDLDLSLATLDEVPPVHVRAMIDMPPGRLIWRRTFTGALDQIPHARHFVRFLLADAWCREDAALIVTELAGNAVRHTGSGRAGGTFIVEVTRTPDSVRVGVYDCGWGGAPRFGMPLGTTTQRGRGLAVVTALADSIGYEGSDDVGHLVWATPFSPNRTSPGALGSTG